MIVAGIDVGGKYVHAVILKDGDILAKGGTPSGINKAEAAEQLYDDGERDANTIRRSMTEMIEQEPLTEIDYISVADSETLKELDKIGDKALVSMAVKIGTTRLIDNVVVG